MKTGSPNDSSGAMDDLQAKPRAIRKANLQGAGGAEYFVPCRPFYFGLGLRSGVPRLPAETPSIVINVFFVASRLGLLHVLLIKTGVAHSLWPPELSFGSGFVHQTGGNLP